MFLFMGFVGVVFSCFGFLFGGMIARASCLVFWVSCLRVMWVCTCGVGVGFRTLSLYFCGST